MKPLGRNQAIACIGYGATLVFSGVLVFVGKVSGAEWLSFAQIFLPVAVGSLLGASAAVKTFRKP